MSSEIKLITGGIKSGKSNFALKLSSTYTRKYFVATAEPFDDEMKQKIQRHQDERDTSYETIEAPLDLASTIEELTRTKHDIDACIIIDCITIWLNNLFYHNKNVDEKLSSLLEALKTSQLPTFIVTNEIGLGLISTDSATRNYTNTLGSLNQQLMRLSSEAFLMVSGAPIRIKP